MKRTAAFLIASLLGLSLAQGVRSLGMGGVLLPGPSGQGANPAYAAFPGKWDQEGFQLPIGLLRLLPLFPDTSPFSYFTDPNAFRNQFDLLSAYDQASHLGSFLINPARSPDEVVFRVSASGVSITDGQGRSLMPSFQAGVVAERPTASIPQPFLPLSFDLGPGTYLSVGPFAGTQGVRVAPNQDLAMALKEGSLHRCQASTPSPCALEAQGSFISGISLALGFSTPLPDIPGLGRVYAGVRGEGFYGLGYAEASAKARPTFDQDGNVSGVSYESRYFLSYPSFLEASLGQGGSGVGYGLRGDVGVAVDGGNWAFGLGVQNLLGFTQWSGVEVTVVDGTETSRTATTKRGDFSAPIFTLNGAYRLPLEVGELLLAADTRFGATTPTLHLGAEYNLGGVAIRTGVGLEGGLRFGLGAGFNLEALSLDLALTTHEAPLVGGTVYGIAMAVRF
ncbi:hypothetical protein [Thermus altitudinis]|uniref:hypothetical protein n=1 Tax=Thermus altitudinis TaxID=2908145 RepID=UPI001FA9F82D|nr:hypothetical protein [Thermus altitudinis]